MFKRKINAKLIKTFIGWISFLPALLLTFTRFCWLDATSEASRRRIGSEADDFCGDEAAPRGDRRYAFAPGRCSGGRSPGLGSEGVASAFSLWNDSWDVILSPPKTC